MCIVESCALIEERSGITERTFTGNLFSPSRLLDLVLPFQAPLGAQSAGVLRAVDLMVDLSLTVNN